MSDERERPAAIAGPTPSLTEMLDAGLIEQGHDPECVTWTCDDHHRHCTLIGTDHDLHACIFC